MDTCSEIVIQQIAAQTPKVFGCEMPPIMGLPWWLSWLASWETTAVLILLFIFASVIRWFSCRDFADLPFKSTTAWLQDHYERGTK